jgi:predicted Rossmann fold nucleotide-binding protein DprA/Smf involved in DNA uptake
MKKCQQNQTIALFCSVKCPGALILDAYEFCRSLRDKPITVVSGFHSPMEQQCLRILLRSANPVVWYLARGMVTRIPPDLEKAVAESRLRIVAPFPDRIRRVTTATAERRNRLVADMANAVIVVHAAAGSKMEALCRELLAAGKPLFTFDHPANAAIIQAGAQVIGPTDDFGL